MDLKKCVYAAVDKLLKFLAVMEMIQIKGIAK